MLEQSNLDVRLATLERQQALQTDGVRRMLSGEWDGFPSLAADLGALSPGIELEPRPPLLESQAPDQQAWQWWSATHMATCTGCPAVAITKNWPLVFGELQARGIDSRPVCVAALATIAIETASTFEPVREAYWLSEEWRQQNLRYYPYYGRGKIQLTWLDNYRHYGYALGVDLVADPERAMEPGISAGVLAHYFLERGVASAAMAQDWAEVRRRVQGAHAGLDRLLKIVSRLGT
jgi:Chitinase class I